MDWKRYPTTLLAFYLLTLILLPCKDICDARDHVSTMSIEQTHDHHEEKQDLCSPFCVCSCCGTSITYFSSVAINFIYWGTGENFSPFSQSQITDFYYTIWQPPKIA
jgi:hypothetical protein